MKLSMTSCTKWSCLWSKEKIKSEVEKAVEDNIKAFLLDVDQKMTESVGVAEQGDVIKTRVLPEWASTAFDASLHA